MLRYLPVAAFKRTSTYRDSRLASESTRAIAIDRQTSNILVYGWVERERERKRGREDRGRETVDCSKLGIGTAYRYLLTGKPHTHVHKPTRLDRCIRCAARSQWSIYAVSRKERLILPKMIILLIYWKISTNMHRTLCWKSRIFRKIIVNPRKIYALYFFYHNYS